MRAFAAAALAVAAAGCASGPPAATAQPAVGIPALATAQAIDAAGIWIGVRSRTEHESPVGHAPTVSWAPIAWAADEGSLVHPGDPLLRFADDVVREWNQRDAYEIQSDDQRRRLDLLRADGDLAGLRSRIAQLEARRRVLQAELAAAETVDADQVRIAELQLANARSDAEAAARRRAGLEQLAARGGAVAAAELAKAREEEVRTRGAVAAPEAALELARLPASASTVRLMRLALADVDAQLGANPEEGLAAELRTAVERRRRRDLDRYGSERRRREYERKERLLADPNLRSTAEGIVQFRDDDLHVGTRVPGGVMCVFVLGRDGLAARLDIPERLRELAQPGARVVLAAPGLPGAVLSGTVRSLAAAPEDARDGRRTFPAVVALDRAPDGLRVGMQAEARLAIAVPGTPASIPSYCIPDPDQPVATMADGSRRSLQGWSAAGLFIAVAGLAPGEQVRIPADAPAPGRMRLSAMIEPEHAVPVRLRSGSWEPVELVPDGTAVKAGMRIARLSKTEYWRPPDLIRSEAELNLARARLDLAVGQLSAADDRARARAAWIRAMVARDQARIQERIARYSYDPVAEARTGAALESAAVGLDRARRDLAAARSERAQGSLSGVQFRDRELDLLRAEVALDRARLDAAAAEVGKDQVELQRLGGLTRNAADDEAARRAQREIAGEQFRSSLAGSAAGYESTLRSVESQLRNLADEEVFAPVDGILVHTRTGEGGPRIGRALETMEPFRIATGLRRRATFELPARLFGRIAAGQRLAVIGGGRGDRVEAEVVKVASAFLPSRDLAAELALGRTVGAEDRVFLVTVAFDPPEGDPLRMTPGASVHADF